MKTAEEAFPASVLAYIESTRLSLAEVGLSKQSLAIRDELYDPFVNYLQRIGDAFGVQATVGVVYTDMMRSEAITVGGRSYIAHDQYFGQVINMMNRMFLSDWTWSDGTMHVINLVPTVSPMVYKLGLLAFEALLLGVCALGFWRRSSFKGDATAPRFSYEPGLEYSMVI